MIVNLIRERNFPGEKATYVDSFEFTAGGGVGEANDALRAAVKEFLSTPAGKKAIEYSSHDFNWGDAVTSVPAEIWEKHGLFPLTNDAVEVVVNQDEVLCKPYNIEEEA